MDVFDRICRDIQEHIPELLRSFAAEAEGVRWPELPEGCRMGHLGEVLLHASELALGDSADGDLRLRMLHAAVRHGEARRMQGFSDWLLLKEFHFLRRAARNFLHERSPQGGRAVTDAAIRVDTVLSLVTRAAVRGFHRPTFESQGTWDRATNDLARGDALPPASDYVEEGGGFAPAVA